MDFLKVEFGKRLSKAIKDAGFTREQFAEKMEVEPASVSRWVNGVNQPTGSRKAKLFEILKVDESYFLSENDLPKVDGHISFTPDQIDQISKTISAAIDTQIKAAVGAPNAQKQDTPKTEKDELIGRITSLLPLLKIDNLRGVAKLVQNKVPVVPATKKPKNT